MHCATLEIKAKVEYTFVPFMLSFCCPAGFWPYLPSISRSNALLLIFLYIHTFCVILCVLRDPAALAKYGFPRYFSVLQGWMGLYVTILTGLEQGINRGGTGGRIGERAPKIGPESFDFPMASLFGFCSHAR